MGLREWIFISSTGRFDDAHAIVAEHNSKCGSDRFDIGELIVYMAIYYHTRDSNFHLVVFSEGGGDCTTDFIKNNHAFQHVDGYYHTQDDSIILFPFDPVKLEHRKYYTNVWEASPDQQRPSADWLTRVNGSRESSGLPSLPLTTPDQVATTSPV